MTMETVEQAAESIQKLLEKQSWNREVSDVESIRQGRGPASNIIYATLKNGVEYAIEIVETDF